MDIKAPSTPSQSRILSPEAIAFVATLCREFEPRRRELLAARAARQKQFDAGVMPDFLPATKSIRDSDWKICDQPRDLLDRRVEITGPTDRKMVINALNCGASTFMADFEDANCPMWENMIEGQANIADAARRVISFEQGGKQYRLNEKTAVAIPRPRGWHLDEKHVLVDGKRISGGIFDFALFMFHNAKEQLARGAGPLTDPLLRGVAVPLPVAVGQGQVLVARHTHRALLARVGWTAVAVGGSFVASGLEDDLEALVLLLLEDAVEVGCVLEAGTVRGQTLESEHVVVGPDDVEQLVAPAAHVTLAHPDRQALVEEPHHRHRSADPP